jgi:hypothetical protein
MGQGAALPDYQIHLGSLPGYCSRRHATDFPQHGACLHADPSRIEHWREQLARLVLGAKSASVARWCAAPHLAYCRAARNRAAVGAKGYHVVSLQYGDCSVELSEFVTQTGNA